MRKTKKTTLITNPDFPFWSGGTIEVPDDWKPPKGFKGRKKLKVYSQDIKTGKMKLYKKTN